jgi:hypothetical protein
VSARGVAYNPAADTLEFSELVEEPRPVFSRYFNPNSASTVRLLSGDGFVWSEWGAKLFLSERHPPFG